MPKKMRIQILWYFWDIQIEKTFKMISLWFYEWNMFKRYGPDLTCAPLSCGTPHSSPHAQVVADCTNYRLVS